SPWVRLLLVVFAVLIVLALLEPVLGLLTAGADLLLRTVAPLLESPIGRLVLLNLLIAIAVVVALSVLRGRFAEFRSGLRLERHLAAVSAWLDGDEAAAEEGFRRVSGSRAAPPLQVPWLGEHAKLALGRLALERRDFDRALHWLARIRDTELPQELKRSVAQLRIRA